MIEHANAHAHAMHSLFCEVRFEGRMLAQNPGRQANEAIVLLSTLSWPSVAQRVWCALP
jgi:hypothetical protein